MAESIQYCPGCNERFAGTSKNHLCPQCGHTLTTWSNAPTIDVPDSAGWDPLGQTSAEPDTLVGRCLGNYEIEDFCGSGGMARVYRARHLTLWRPCAIKILSPRLVEQRPDTVEAFLAEARVAAGLVHPNVVTIHTIGECEGLHFIEMEFVDGRSLAHLADQSGPLEPIQATQFMVHISAALSAAHDMGLIHRDIKPANVLVNADKIAKLADFGLAKRVATNSPSEQGNVLTGTPYYMAPELFDGRPADRRSDVYAMGVTYFALCTGDLPFVAKTIPQLARLHQQEDPPDMRKWCADIPPQICELVQRCLAKNPDERYDDARSLYEQLRTVFGSLRDLTSLLKEALAGHRTTITGQGDHFEVLVELPGGRSQKVIVEIVRGAAIADQVVRVFSTCAPTSDNYYRKALELNAAIPHGAIAIEEIDAAPYFVMVNAHPRATCDAAELRESILTVARHADEIEHQLTGGDRH